MNINIGNENYNLKKNIVSSFILACLALIFIIKCWIFIQFGEINITKGDFYVYIGLFASAIYFMLQDIPKGKSQS